MQVNTISTDSAGFNNILYSHDNNVLEYLQQNISNAYERLQGYNSSFLETAMTMYDRVNSSEAIMRAKSMIHNIGGHMDPMGIYPISEENIYDANYNMQRYIMIQPDMYKLNKQQRCSAFEDTYLDVDPDSTVLEEHLDYRSVMDGLLTEDEDGNGVYTEYLDMENTELHFMDKVAIMDTWDTVRNMVAQGLDPSSVDEHDREL
jgi:hypothetical protein